MNKPTSRIVGVKAITYPEKRNFAGIEVPGFQFKKVKDFYKFPAYAYFKIKKKSHPFWLNLFQDFDSGKYELLHFFNAASVGKKPWITTFEYYMPRGAHLPGTYPEENKYIHKVLQLMEGESCKKLIALSEWAREAQLAYLKAANHPTDVIESKLITIHPPQKKLLESVKEKSWDGPLKLLFVGADFFRKGGLESLEVVHQLIKNGLEIEFSIISRMQFGDYASKSTQKDVNRAKEIIQQHESIHLYDFLSNEEVVQKMIYSHLVLLPSFEETYGYTVLEGQAAACPVITTNGTAFTEINNNEIGWVIEVELDEHKRSVPRSDLAKTAFQQKVKSSLEEILVSVYHDRDLLAKKGAKALDKIERQHHPKTVALQLQNIYNSALND